MAAGPIGIDLLTADSAGPPAVGVPARVPGWSVAVPDRHLHLAERRPGRLRWPKVAGSAT